MKLFNAYESRNIEKFKLALNEEHPDTPNRNGNTLLREICHQYKDGDESYVKLILEKGADPNLKKLENYQTYLKTLLANPSKVGFKVQTLENILKLLLEYGAVINVSENTSLLQSAINLSIQTWNPNIVALLVDKGINTNATVKIGSSQKTRLQILKEDITKNSYKYPGKKMATAKAIITLLEKGYTAYTLEKRRIEAQQQQENIRRQAEEKRNEEETQRQLTASKEAERKRASEKIRIEAVKRKEEERLIKEEKNQHHLFSADNINQCKKKAINQSMKDAITTTLACTPSAFMESAISERRVGFTECDKRGTKADNLMLKQRLKQCETDENHRQDAILKKARDKHLEKFFENFLRICKLLNLSPDGVLSSEEYNLVIEKMEEERAEKIKIINNYNLAVKERGDRPLFSRMKISTFLFNNFKLDNKSFKKALSTELVRLRVERFNKKNTTGNPHPSRNFLQYHFKRSFFPKSSKLSSRKCTRRRSISVPSRPTSYSRSSSRSSRGGFAFSGDAKELRRQIKNYYRQQDRRIRNRK